MLRLTLLALALTAGAPSHSEPAADLAARIGANTVSLAEVDALVQTEDPEAWQAIYEARRRALEAIVDQRLLAAKAARQGIGVDSLIAREITAKISPVEADDVATFYNENRQRLGGRPLDDVRDQIRDYLADLAVQEAQTRYLAGLRHNARVEILLDPPRRRVEVKADEPTKGPANAPVVVVEYSDFQCPYCRRAKETLNQVATTYGNRVRFVFRDFPLAMHKDAHRAAQAAQCAHEQGAFWPYHDILFDNIRKLGEADLQQHAETAGLDAAAFAACLTADRYVDAVDADLAGGQAHGVSGTQAFFINGRFLSGAQPLEAFREIIDDELTRAGVTPP